MLVANVPKRFTGIFSTFSIYELYYVVYQQYAWWAVHPGAGPKKTGGLKSRVKSADVSLLKGRKPALPWRASKKEETEDEHKNCLKKNMYAPAHTHTHCSSSFQPAQDTAVLVFGPVHEYLLFFFFRFYYLLLILCCNMKTRHTVSVVTVTQFPLLLKK